MNLSRRLKLARRKRGESQVTFAGRFSVCQPVYARWESGARNPSGPSRALIEIVLKDLDHERPKDPSLSAVTRPEEK